MKTLKLSTLEHKVLFRMFVLFDKHVTEVTVGELAKFIYRNVKLNQRPSEINNSIISAIRQINRKYPGTIEGFNFGRNGKLVHLSKPAATRLILTLN